MEENKRLSTWSGYCQCCACVVLHDKRHLLAKLRICSSENTTLILSLSLVQFAVILIIRCFRNWYIVCASYDFFGGVPSQLMRNLIPSHDLTFRQGRRKALRRQSIGGASDCLWTMVCPIHALFAHNLPTPLHFAICIIQNNAFQCTLFCTS